ncbi:MAG TPA: hypothetical protein VLE97_01775 [Gaiellaceae bacterium]|nr:hypothetical protein [Gaiellaceae bacterium]
MRAAANKLPCPECGASTRVVDSRLVPAPVPGAMATVRRRRECTRKHRFSTVETYSTLRMDLDTIRLAALPSLDDIEKSVAEIRRNIERKP